MRGGVVVLFALSGTAGAQSLNVNFGPPNATLPGTFAAAGGAGTWNTVTGVAGGVYELTASDGSTVTLTQSPTTTLITATDPAVTGDDATLLQNGLVTSGDETCLMFSGVAPGMYEVLIYAWLPGQPSVLSRTRQDDAPSTIDVGGAWTGEQVENVTFAKYVVQVGADGQLPAHSGRVPGAGEAALNAVQIRPLGDAPPIDPPIDPPPEGGPVPDDGGCEAGGGVGWGAAVLLGLFARRRRSG